MAFTSLRVSALRNPCRTRLSISDFRRSTATCVSPSRRRCRCRRMRSAAGDRGVIVLLVLILFSIGKCPPGLKPPCERQRFRPWSPLACRTSAGACNALWSQLSVHSFRLKIFLHRVVRIFSRPPVRRAAIFSLFEPVNEPSFLSNSWIRTMA
jgi:hypothetical protein